MFILGFYLVSLFVFFFIRIYLLLNAGLFNNSHFTLILKALFIGFRFDVAVCGYVLAPLVLSLPLFEKKFIKEIFSKKIVYWYFTIAGFILFYFSILEIFYFKEFGQRYNHLAIEYLDYPQEVFSNIYQYYPIISASLIILFVYFFVNKLFYKIVYSSSFFCLNFFKRFLFWIGLLIFVFIGCRSSFDHRPMNIALSYFSKNQYLNEISLNGFFSLGYAVLDKIKNTVDYKKKYLSVSQDENEFILRNILSEEKNIRFESDKGISRYVNINGKPNKYNVVIIIEESLGAEYTGVLGSEINKKYNLTPYIDELSKKSIFFTNAYSTGTRTARGIEGIIASFPPIPGESSIKRSKSINNIFTIGNVLKSQGYSTHFIYGGQAMFDNMRGFFNSNGFDNIIEEKDFSNPEFKTVWGVSDEDLFKKADKILNGQSKPFLAVLLTTSNHMPFTFPDNKIKKLSGDIKDSERLNAIKYADYAVGEFLKKAQNSKYFKNTLFVIVADHGTRVFGEAVIPVYKFHIPVLFYGPEILILKNNIKSINTIFSQIDIAPTILGILNIPYKSVFFGRNILNIDGKNGYAPLLYDKLIGLLDNKNLSVLYPNKTFSVFNSDYFQNENNKDFNYENQSKNFSQEKICISYFQFADFVFKSIK
ncbi:MAG TPA: LTA synthase family protein [bacterium]|nr:LTA synthase family protein [bacterium]